MTADAERLAAIRSEIESGHDGKTWQAYETAIGAEYFAVEENRGLFAAKLAPVTGTPTYGRDEILHAIALHNGVPVLLAELDRLIAERDALRARIEAAPHGGSCRSRFDEWTGKRHTYRKGPCDCWKSAALAGDQPKATPEPRAVTEAERMSLEAMRFRQGLPSAFDFNSPRSGI